MEEILNKHRNEDTEILISVCVITYNHQSYIEEALEGIFSQNFRSKIEIVISDDNSSDNTCRIVKQIKNNHPRGNLIRFFEHSKNKGVATNFFWSLSQCRGKFVAICEGDDYWIDKNKLSKQFKFLNNNRDYAACFTNARKLNEGSGETTKYIKTSVNQTFNFRDIIRNGGGFFPTASLVFRNDLGAFPPFFYRVKSADRALAMFLGMKGDFYLLNEITTVYRLHAGGVFTSIADELEKRIEIDFDNLKLLENFNVFTEFEYKDDITTIISNYSQRILVKYDQELINSRRKYLFKNLKLWDILRFIKNSILPINNSGKRRKITNDGIFFK